MTSNDLTGKEQHELEQWAFDNGDCPYWLEAWDCSHYAGDIPYGVETGDTGTVDEWLCDRVDEVIDYFELTNPNELEVVDVVKTNEVN